ALQPVHLWGRLRPTLAGVNPALQPVHLWGRLTPTLAGVNQALQPVHLWGRLAPILAGVNPALQPVHLWGRLAPTLAGMNPALPIASRLVGPALRRPTEHRPCAQSCRVGTRFMSPPGHWSGGQDSADRPARHGARRS